MLLFTLRVSVYLPTILEGNDRRCMVVVLVTKDSKIGCRFGVELNSDHRAIVNKLLVKFSVKLCINL